MITIGPKTITGDLINHTRKEEPTVRSKLLFVLQLTRQLMKKKLFCLLPWDRNNREKDEMSFRHFAQFGTLEYYETDRDKKEPLSYGYVRYFKEDDTRAAAEKSNLM